MTTETSASANPVPTPPAAPPPRRGLRWWPAVLILILGAIAQSAAWRSIDDRTTQVMVAWGLYAFEAFLLVLWWLTFSRMSLRVKLWGFVIGGVLCAASTRVIRIDDFAGDMIPKFAWAWSSTREDRAEEFRKTKPAAETASEAKAGATEFVVSRDDWPDYRGRERDGIVHGIQLDPDWEAHPPRKVWRHPVGLGWGSFVVVGNRAYTQEQWRDDEAVVCYDVETGEPVWSHKDRTRFEESLGGDGPRATPTIADGRLFALGATGILNCLDPVTGAKLWSTNILTDAKAQNLTWAMSGSPLVVGDAVIVNPGGSEGKSVIAYDVLTGHQIWSAGSAKAGYASPQSARLCDRDVVLMFDNVGLSTYDPDAHKLLWDFGWTNGPPCNAAQPITLSDDRVFIGNGYGKGSVLLQVKRDGDQWSVDPIWESKHLKLKFNSAVLHGDSIYGLDEGILTCISVADGKRQWKGGRYAYGQLVLVDDLILVLAESGEVALVPATPDEFREVAKFQAIEGKTWNNPVVCRGKLFVRNCDEAACYELPVAKAAATAEVPAAE